jgi:hypothetical protein
VRCCVSRALTPLAATSALLLGCGSDSGPAPNSAAGAHRPDLAAHDGRTGTAARGAVLAAAERAITLDARRRARSGELKDRTRRTSCKPRKGEDAKADAVVYDCLAITFEIKATVNAPPLASGYPFQVRVDYPAHRFSWCKVEPVAGEGARQAADKMVIPDDSCGGILRR